MHARLGFSVAANLRPDVLLGVTIVLVSHDLATVERISDRACLLVQGRLELDGEPSKVVTRYREIFRR